MRSFILQDSPSQLEDPIDYCKHSNKPPGGGGGLFNFGPSGGGGGGLFREGGLLEKHFANHFNKHKLDS